MCVAIRLLNKLAAAPPGPPPLDLLTRLSLTFLGYLKRKKRKSLQKNAFIFQKTLNLKSIKISDPHPSSSSCAIPETGVGASPHIPVLSVCF